MTDPTLIADLIRAGVDPDLVGRVANALAACRVENRVDETAEKRRAWDREYRRNRKKSPPETTRNPPDPPDNASSALSFLEVEKKEKKTEKKERERGHKIPPDWQPNEKALDAGHQLGFSDQQISEQAEDMRLWAQSNEHRAVARKSDWDLTFLGWLRRNKPNGHANGKSARNSLAAVADEAIARAKERDRTVDLGPGDYSGGRRDGSAEFDWSISEPEAGQSGDFFRRRGQDP